MVSVSEEVNVSVSVFGVMSTWCEGSTSTVCVCVGGGGGGCASVRDIKSC